MKAKYWKKILISIAILTIIAAAGTLAACGAPPTLEEEGFVVKVTYHLNGGTLSGREKFTLYLKDGQPIPKPEDTTGLGVPVLDSKHVIKAYYYAETDNEGNTVLDENEVPVPSEREVMFGTDLAAEGNNVTLVVVWSRKVGVTFRIPGVEDRVVNYLSGEEVARPQKSPVREGFTFRDYFADESLTQRQTFPIAISDGMDDVVIYTDWLEGEWLVLREYKDLLEIRNHSKASSKIYQDGDINCADDDGNAQTIPQIDSFGGKWYGNGYTVSNLLCEVTQSDNSPRYGLFRVIRAGASIEDLTFDRLTYSLQIRRKILVNVGLLAGQIEGNPGLGADNKVTLDVVLNDCKVIVDDSQNLGATVVSGSGDYEGVVGSITDGATLVYAGGKIPVTVVRS